MGSVLSRLLYRIVLKLYADRDFLKQMVREPEDADELVRTILRGAGGDGHAAPHEGDAFANKTEKIGKRLSSA